VNDASGTAHKFWQFNSSGLVTQHYTRALPGSDRPLQVDSTWTTDANGKPYIGVATTTYDVGKAYQVWKRTEQTLDAYGNLTQMKVFDWGNSSTARRVYTNTYLATSNYVNAYIRNRLLTTTYSENGGSAETMVSHEYDNYAAGCASGVGSCAITATSGARQKDSAFGTGYTLRGNITSSFVYGSGSWLSGNPTSWAWRLYDDTGKSITVAGLSTTMNWNSALGLTSASGPNGVSSGTVYDSYARPASKTSPTSAVTTFTYSGNVTTATTNSRWVKTTVDGFGRPRLTESGYSGTTVSVVENEYEPCACTPIGKLKRTTRPYAPGGTKYWTTYTYDAPGRTVSVVAPDGASTTAYVYEGIP
jgi:YD repeat-containing protein